jgi:hypothetical protein
MKKMSYKNGKNLFIVKAELQVTRIERTAGKKVTHPMKSRCLSQYSFQLHPLIALANQATQSQNQASEKNW